MPNDADAGTMNCEWASASCPGHNADEPDNPWAIVYEKVYPNGTLVIMYANGITTINGYALGNGVKDLDQLASRVDQRAKAAGFDKPDILETSGLILDSCNPQVCTWDFYSQTRTNHGELLKLVKDPFDLLAVCFNVGGQYTISYLGGSFCVAIDKHGIGSYETGAVGTALPGAAAMFSVTVQQSNGGIRDQGGKFYYVNVDDAAPDLVGGGVAWSPDHSIFTGSVGAGGQLGETWGNAGTSETKTQMWFCWNPPC
jgi:hypothetical protein